MGFLERLQITYDGETQTLSDTGFVTLTGDNGYGSLTVYGQNNATNPGEWDYSADANMSNVSGQAVSFTATITDADSDVDSDTFNITITDGEGPGAPEPATLNLVEDDLLGTTAESTDDTGSALSFTLGSDNLASIVFNGTVGSITGGYDDGTITWLTSNNGLTLTGTVSTDSAASITLNITGIDLTTGAFKVDVKMTDEFTHTAPSSGADINNFVITNIEVIGTDIDGDPATANINVEVTDDVPVAFTPDAQLISNVGGGVITGDLNTIPGADGAESIVISTFTYDGTTYTADGTTTLTSNANVISLTGIGTNVITGSTGEGTVFTMTLDDSVDGYSFNLVQPIDDGSGIIPIELSGVESGNPDFISSDTPTEAFDLLFSGETNGAMDTVNTSQGGTLADGSVGVGGGQTVNDGNILAIDFVTNLVVDKNGSDYTYNHSGHYSLSTFAFAVAGSGDVLVRAYDSTTSDPPGTDPAVHHAALWDSNYLIQQQIGSITINGEPVDASSLTPDSYGGYTISGVDTGDVISVSVLGGFDRLEIENSATPEGDRYDVGNFGYTEVAAGDSINVDFGLTLTDGDGDTSTGSIDLTIEPALQASTLVGGDFDDTLAYDPLDTIDGGGGFDTLLVDGTGDLNFNNVSNIEKLDLNDDTADQTVSLTLNDVLSMTGDGNLTGGVPTLELSGSATDTVQIDISGWTDMTGTTPGLFTKDGDSVMISLGDDAESGFSVVDMNNPANDIDIDI